MGLALIQYTQNNDETLPYTSFVLVGYSTDVANVQKWMDVIYPHVKSIQVFNCPDNIASSLDYVPCTLTADGSCSNRAGYRFGTYAVNDADYWGTAYSSPYVSTNPRGERPSAKLLCRRRRCF